MSLIFSKSRFVDRAAPDLGRRDAGLLGDDAGGELLRRHFQREEADDAAIDGCGVAVGADFARPGLGDVVGDIGGERGLSHAGAAGEDDEVGGLQTAHPGVEIGQPGGQSRKAAVALIGVRRHVDGGGESLGEALETALVTSGFGKLEKLALGVFDVALRRRLDRRVVGEIDHVLADSDQVAPDRQIVDGAAIILGVDDGRRLGGQPGQVLIDGQPGNVEVRRQERLERDRRRQLAGANQSAGQLVDALVDAFEEMLRFKEIGNAVERLVIDEDSPQQRLFGLDIVGRRAERRFRG